jgi:hypothetical protein
MTEPQPKTTTDIEEMDWKLTITPADARLIETLRFSVEDVARAFRIPAEIVDRLKADVDKQA